MIWYCAGPSEAKGTKQPELRYSSAPLSETHTFLKLDPSMAKHDPGINSIKLYCKYVQK